MDTTTSFYVKPETSAERKELYARLDRKNTAPLWEVLVSPSPSNDPLTVYFVTDVAVLVPSLTVTE